MMLIRSSSSAARAALRRRSLSTQSSLHLRCSGCGELVDGSSEPVFKCPRSDANPDVDHVLVPKPSAGSDDISMNPFIRYRSRLYSHRVAMSRGMEDARYVAMVQEIDNALIRIDGNGFTETPLKWHEELNLFAKDETNNVGQSHKARHLQNVMIYLQVLKLTSTDDSLSKRRLAVASCGNAGLAAATVAAAAEWPIDVCIPHNADDSVVNRLDELGAHIHMCGRDGAPVSTVFGDISTQGAADPTLAVCRSLVSEHDSIPFSVQGPECGLAVEGGKTLAWEIADAMRRDHRSQELERCYVQVGGGALGAGLVQGFAEDGCGIPSLECVEPAGKAVLNRALELMAAQGLRQAAGAAAKTRGEFMWPWDEPESIAHGILDDETYDWVALCDGMLSSGGGSHIVDDAGIIEAKGIAEGWGVPVCHTGAAGLAGLIQSRRAGKMEGEKPSVVILSGLDRTMSKEDAANVRGKDA
jgi:threonine synthase